jgi:hypothetical protein
MAGLSRHGYVCDRQPLAHPRPDDLLVLWNRSPVHEPFARRYERAGARVVIAENGYLPRTPDGSAKYYALALDHHLGAGRWFVGDQPRFPIEDQPWRERRGEHVLVLCQRGIGEPGITMPPQWKRDIAKRLGRITRRPLIIRPHPSGRDVPLAPDLDRAHCVVTWASGAGIKAIQAGVPVFHDLPEWVGAPAAARLAHDLEHCQTPDRGTLWRIISWGQWLIAEVESGLAFDRLLHEGRGLLRAGQQPLDDRGAGDGAGPPCGGPVPRALELD